MVKENLDFSRQESNVVNGTSRTSDGSLPDIPAAVNRSGVAVVTGRSCLGHYRTDITMKTHSAIVLTNTQRATRATAIKRSDSACSLPARINRRSAQKLAASLVEKGLVREVLAKASMPIWRQDDAGRSMTLIITKPGRGAVRASAEAVGQESKPLDAAGERDKLNESRRSPKDGSKISKDGSKISKVITLVSRQAGASLPELVSATGWLPHTTRAALTGLRKRGYTVSLVPTETGGKVYLMVGIAERPTAT
jgi:hypothetical protein